MSLLYNLKSQMPKRKWLRNQATLAEQRLWMCLKGKQLNGWKFRRQYGIGFYIVDFYCPALRLVIEVDGGYHLAPEQQRKDQERQDFIASLGIHVLRFTNEQVLEELPQVLAAIAQGPLR